MSDQEALTRLAALFIAACVGVWVGFDARKRGFTVGAAIGWGLGVWVAMILFLPPYLWVRRKYPIGSGAPDSLTKERASAAPLAGVPCPY